MNGRGSGRSGGGRSGGGSSSGDGSASGATIELSTDDEQPRIEIDLASDED